MISQIHRNGKVAKDSLITFHLRMETTNHSNTQTTRHFTLATSMIHHRTGLHHTVLNRTAPNHPDHRDPVIINQPENDTIKEESNSKEPHNVGPFGIWRKNDRAEYH